jgi:hypothetical protein
VAHADNNAALILSIDMGRRLLARAAAAEATTEVVKKTQ